MMNNTDSSIYSVFEKTAEKFPGRTAVIYIGTKYTYANLKKMAENFSESLSKLGIHSGEKVILYIPNSIQWIVSWLAVQRLGAVTVPITPIYTPYDIEYIARDSQAGAIICSDTNFGYVKRVLANTAIQKVIISSLIELLPVYKRLFGLLFDIIPGGKVRYDRHTASFKKLVSMKFQDLSMPEHSTSGSDTAQILYTGGTIKHPKGVPMSHDLFLISALEQILVTEPMFPPEENVIYAGAPLFHILGQTCSLSTILTGGCIILQPKVNMDATFAAIERYRAKTMIGVPTFYRMILEHDRLDNYDLSSLQYCFSAGDVLPVEVGKRWFDRFHKPIFQGYGATETCGGISMCYPSDENPAKSVGRVVPSKEVLLVDPATLEPVKTGEPGELLVRSAHMVSAYLNKPEETEISFIEIDGKKWYRTSDIMQFDDDGNLFFVDRTVDLIKHKGYRISSSEVEAVLQEHPAVIASCVIGIPDPKVGERIKAFVVLKDDVKGITGYDLIHWCKDKLVAYKIPQYIEFRDMLPKSKVGKLLRREIRTQEESMR